MGEGRPVDNASAGANGSQPQSILTDSYSLSIESVSMRVSGRKMGKKTENYVMYARVVSASPCVPARSQTATASAPSVSALIKYLRVQDLK